MGKSNKRGGADIDWEQMASDDGFEKQNNGPHRGVDNGNGRSSPNSHIYNGENSRDEAVPQAQSKVDFDPYLEVVEEFKTQLLGSQESLKRVYSFYAKQVQEIQEVDKTKQQLEKVAARNKHLKTTVDTLRNLEREKDDEYNLKATNIEKTRRQLERAMEKAEEGQKKLEEEKDNFKKRMRAVSAEQDVKLNEQRAKLEKEQDEKYIKRVEILERETNEQRDDDKQMIVDLEAENKKLLEKLEEQKSKLEQVENGSMEQEKLKLLYKQDAEEIKLELKRTQNEFGLNTGSTDS
jgi:hypothetical protein